MTGVPLELLLSPWALALLGLLVGSFLNVVVHRFPLMLERQWWSDVTGQLGDGASHQRVFGNAAPAALAQTAQALTSTMSTLPPLGLSQPASRCPSCAQRIRWYQNVPVFSWLQLRGRCAACQAPIGWRYPLIELLTALLFGLMGWRFGPSPVALVWCAMVALLVTLAAIDWDTTLLPDALTLPLLWGGLVAVALGLVPALSLPDALWGVVAGYLSLWSVYWLFKLATGKEGMGYGDFKLLAALGAWLGWQAILPIVLMASAIGALVGLAMKAGGALREGRFVPFGPFLVGGGLVVLLAGVPRVLGWIGWA